MQIDIQNPDFLKERKAQRIALKIFFFFSGTCFASWASRIPTIKDFFNLNEAQLGTVLLIMPICSMIGLPISGWLVSKFDSRKPMIVAFILFSIALISVGYSQSILQLVISIGLFSFCLRVINIAINTQSITLQKKYEKKIVGSFHGVWSFGGVVGVLFSTLMVQQNISIQTHLLIISILTIISVSNAYRYILKKDRETKGNKIIKGKPDPFIIYLGLLVFCAAICEGGMYDWSGVYFKEIIHQEVFTYGYLTFMTCMTISRFVSDKLMDKIGIPKTYILSALLITIGILIAVLLPRFWPVLFGFCLVGFGTAFIFPMTFMLAGTSKKYSAGMAISIVSTFAIVGMLIGPPLIGYLAHAFGLKNAFFTFVIGGLLFIPISKLFFKHQKETEGTTYE